MKFLVLLIFSSIALVACLPDVSTELSEQEARSLLQREVLNLCQSKSSAVISNVLGAVDNAEAIATRENWIFKLRLPAPKEELEALVFPSKIISGSFIVQVQTRTCR